MAYKCPKIDCQGNISELLKFDGVTYVHVWSHRICIPVGAEIELRSGLVASRSRSTATPLSLSLSFSSSSLHPADLFVAESVVSPFCGSDECYK